jgi:hypothetical protein
MSDLSGMSMSEVVALMDGHHPPQGDQAQVDAYWCIFCDRAEDRDAERFSKCFFLTGMPAEFEAWQRDYALRQQRARAAA